MKLTPNYNLKKPDSSDYARPDPFNENADAIDQALKNIETALGDKLGTSGDGKDVNYVHNNQQYSLSLHGVRAQG